MRRLAGALLMPLALLGCSPQASGGASTADCDVAVRFEGVVYVQDGFSAAAVEPLGPGEESSCEDTGPNPRGAVFADEPVRISVWAFPGYDPRHVLGVRFDEQLYRVMFAEDVPTTVRRDIALSGLVDQP